MAPPWSPLRRQNCATMSAPSADRLMRTSANAFCGLPACRVRGVMLTMSQSGA